MKKNKNYSLLFLGIIILLGSWLRLNKLNLIPAGFHQDEVVNAYVGKFILKNGQDLYGHHWPLFYFNKWGDFPPVLPMYFIGLGSVIFSNTVLAARIVIAFFGILTIFIFYFFSLKIFKNKKAALFSVLMLAINPWHIAFSRTGAEGILSLFFYLCGLNWLLIKQNHWQRFTTTIIFLFAYLSYPGMRLIVPLTFLVWLLFYYLKNKKISLFLIFNLCLFFSLTLIISQTSWGKARFNQTSILAQVNQQKEYLNQFIYNEDSVIIARIFNNKFVYLAREFFRQFFSYFSPVFLFIDGGKPPWFAIPNNGLFYLINFFLIIVFFLKPIKKSEFQQWQWLILSLLIISILPAALTSENSPHMHRSIIMIPFILLFSTAGYLTLLKTNLKKFLLILIIGFVLEVVYFYHNYFQHVSMYTAIPRSDANQKTAIFLSRNKNKYHNIYFYVTGWFPIYYLYFSDNYQPTLINQIKTGMRLEKIDNIYFINQDCPDEKENFRKNYLNKDLLIFSSTCALSKNWSLKRIKSINNINNTPVYWLYQINNF